MGWTCICNATCYLTYSACTCNGSCHGYSGCVSCDSTCYVYSCTCDGPCDGYCTKQGCTCYLSCHGYSCSTCNATCYLYSSCSCDSTTYGYVPCLICDSVQYGKEVESDGFKAGDTPAKTAKPEGKTDGLKLGDTQGGSKITKSESDGLKLSEMNTSEVYLSLLDGFGLGGDDIAFARSIVFADGFKMSEPSLMGYWYRNYYSDSLWKTVPLVINMLLQYWTDRAPSDDNIWTAKAGASTTWGTAPTAAPAWEEKSGASTSWA